MQPYRLYYHESVWLALPGLKEGDRRSVVSFCRAVANNPFLESDYTESGESGASWQCVLREGWAIVYYVDHATREMKIGRIQRPDH